MGDPLQTIRAYETWLQERHWDYFGTFTTRYPITLKSARRLMDKLAGRLNTAGPVTMFWAAERFELRDGYHLHALVESPVPKDAIWRFWFKRYGRADVQDYDPKLGGAGYVAKYVTKKIADFDIESRKMQEYEFFT